MDAKLALRGLLAFARFDRKGTLFFDPTMEGAARSFRVYILALPAFALITSIQLAQLKPEQDSFLVIAAQLIAYVLRSIAFPLYSQPALHWLGRDARWPRLVSAYNWLSVAQYAGVALLIMSSRAGVPDPFIRVLSMGFLFFSVLIEGFMFEAVLESGVATAVALVLADLVVSESIDLIARGFF